MNTQQLETDMLQTIIELEKEHQIRFPAGASRYEFFEDCLTGELDKYDLYDLDPHRLPDCTGIVLDMAKLYGYTI